MAALTVLRSSLLPPTLVSLEDLEPLSRISYRTLFLSSKSIFAVVVFALCEFNGYVPP